MLSGKSKFQYHFFGHRKPGPPAGLYVLWAGSWAKVFYFLGLSSLTEADKWRSYGKAQKTDLN
jgi:hypothetical protein